uniref:Uncharacterized protein LOC110202310 n=1 Tax=Phascolarctos cinereus TaxID=38626 RepID=A0A6P5JRQ5_PHACI|nr:uncharacterized protein LOC110202310 [Phascolarctos cinereus]
MNCGGVSSPWNSQKTDEESYVLPDQEPPDARCIRSQMGKGRRSLGSHRPGPERGNVQSSRATTAASAGAEPPAPRRARAARAARGPGRGRGRGEGGGGGRSERGGGEKRRDWRSKDPGSRSLREAEREGSANGSGGRRSGL